MKTQTYIAYLKEHRAYMAEHYSEQAKIFAESAGLTLQQYLDGTPVTACIYCGDNPWRDCTEACLKKKTLN